jgi:Domain of unknown function (DUF4388)
MLEQINLASVLQRIEAHAKTGLCVIQQGVQRAELYFGEGRLLYIDPVRGDTTLGDRLVETGVISLQALQSAQLFIETAELSEMRLALTLIDLGYVDPTALRAWAEQQAVSVLQLLFTWSTGEIYFEEHVAPPADRLLVALSITSLLSASSDVSAVSSASNKVAYAISSTSSAVQEQPKGKLPARIPDASTLIDASQFFTEIIPATPVPFAQESLPSDIELAATVVCPAIAVPLQRGAPSLSKVPVMVPIMSRHIDTSFMQPDMVLVPADLSALREQNPQIALTPEQWQLLARADSHTSLQMACQLLGWRPEMVCRVAGELLVEGLLHVVPPMPEYVQELSRTAQTFMTPSLSADFSRSVTNSAPLWPAAESEVLPQYMSILSDEAQPQGGNRALQLNNATPAYGDAYAYAGAGGGRL